MEENLKHLLFMLYCRDWVSLKASPYRARKKSESCSSPPTLDQPPPRLRQSAGASAKAESGPVESGSPVLEELCSTASLNTQFELNPADTAFPCRLFFWRRAVHTWREYP